MYTIEKSNNLHMDDRIDLNPLHIQVTHAVYFMMYILFKMFRIKNFVHFNLFQLKFDMNRRKLSFDKVILLLVELFKTHCDVGLTGYCTVFSK